MTKLPQMDTPEPVAPVMPPPPPVKQPSKLRTYISIGVLVAILAVVLYAVRNNTSAGDLSVGTCFDRPSTSSDFSTVEKHPCTEPHDAEVVLVAEYTESQTFPISLTLDRYLDNACLPAAEAYIGRAAETIDDLKLGLFSPTLDAWSNGERTMTCYVLSVDESKLTKSVKGGAAAS
jgi:hypothetical protein